jgi:peroxiredoxin
VIDVGASVPAARVATSPNETTTLDDLVGSGPILLVFYLFDWSST